MGSVNGLFSLQVIANIKPYQVPPRCVAYALHKLVHGTCAYLVTYYNSCKCCILGDTDIDKTKVHGKQWEGNSE